MNLSQRLVDVDAVAFLALVTTLLVSLHSLGLVSLHSLGLVSLHSLVSLEHSLGFASLLRSPLHNSPQ